MKLANYPADYASAHDNNLFEFDEIDTSRPCELHFYDGESNLLGVRRYVGRESITTSPKAFVLSQLNPHPAPLVEGCRFAVLSGREAALSVGYNNNSERTPEVLFTCSHKALAVDTPLGSSEEWRTIAADECDEVTICVAPSTTVIALAIFANGVSVPLAKQLNKHKGIVALCFNANHILSHSSAPQGATEFEVVVRSGAVECVRVHYRVVPATEGGVRLAWLSADGSIRYHTFPRPTSHRLLASRREGVAVESWEEVSLDSGVLSIREARTLSEIVASPLVWRLVNGEFEPQSIVEHNVLRGVARPERVSLTVCPQEKTSFNL